MPVLTANPLPRRHVTEDKTVPFTSLLQERAQYTAGSHWYQAGITDTALGVTTRGARWRCAATAKVWSCHSSCVSVTPEMMTGSAVQNAWAKLEPRTFVWVGGSFAQKSNLTTVHPVFPGAWPRALQNTLTT